MATVLDGLAGLAHVTVATPSRTDGKELPANERLRLVQVRRVAARKVGALRGFSRVRRALLDWRPMVTRCMDDLGWREAVEAEAATADLVWVQSLGVYGQIRKYLCSPAVVDLPDVESAKVRRALATGAVSTPRLPTMVDLMRLHQAEAFWGRGRDWFVVCSSVEKRRLARRAGRTWIIRNAVPIPELSPGQQDHDARLLFVGALGYGPNREAVLRFCREVLPSVLRQSDRASLTIVGSNPPAEIAALANHPGIRVAGDVEDTSSHLRSAAVVVAPILNGGGTRLKILEAMAHGRAVVSTTVGAEGLDVTHGKNILLADSPSAFADQCVRLLRCAPERYVIGQAARAFVVQHHTPLQAVEDLRALIRDGLNLAWAN
jgi:glycosyltransferase involved in cell wall biosynthesis